MTMSQHSLLTSILSYVPDPLVCAFMGRLPDAHESSVITDLRALINTAYDASVHEDYLRRIFAAAGLEGEYSSTGQHWKSLGFQQPNPASDIRGGGVLSLQCITYFLEKRPSVSASMVARRFRTHGEDGSYPWATAGVVLTRVLATIFGLIQANGAPVRQQEKQVFWHLLRSEEDFFRLFGCLFVVLDNIWQQEQATYMDFPRIQAMTEQHFRALLTRMPQSVTMVEELVNPELLASPDYTSLPEETSVPAVEQPKEVPTTDDLLFDGYDYNCEDHKVESVVPSAAANTFWLDTWSSSDELVPTSSNDSLRYRNPVMVV